MAIHLTQTSSTELLQLIIIIIIKCIYRASFPYGSKTLYSWQVNNKIIKIITNIKLLSKKKYYYYYCLKEEYYNMISNLEMCTSLLILGYKMFPNNFKSIFYMLHYTFKPVFKIVFHSVLEWFILSMICL